MQVKRMENKAVNKLNEKEMKIVAKQIESEITLFCNDLGLNSVTPDLVNRILYIIKTQFSNFSFHSIQDALLKFVARNLGLKDYEIYGKELKSGLISKILAKYRDNYMVRHHTINKQPVNNYPSLTPEIARKNFDNKIMELFNGYLDTGNIDFINTSFLYDTLKERGIIKMTPEIWLEYVSRIGAEEKEVENLSGLDSIINKIIGEEKELNVNEKEVKRLVLYELFKKWKVELIDVKEILKK